MLDEAIERLLIDLRARKLERQHLRLADGGGAIFEEMADHSRAGGLEFGKRDDLMDEADAPRLFGSETFAGQRIAAQLPKADPVR